MSTRLEPQSWGTARSNLVAAMRQALTATPRGFVNLSVPKHTITTPCLWEMTFDGSLAGRSLDVRWSDGSRTEFPCGVLQQMSSAQVEPESLLRLGLMSFRHPELDYIVDLYACRNRELAQLRSMAAEEHYAYARAKEILLDPALASGIVIEVYHTGLEPMVVGFYRGVAAALVERQLRSQPRTVWVRPMLYAGKPEKERLTVKSAGADPKNYIRSKVWM